MTDPEAGRTLEERVARLERLVETLVRQGARTADRQEAASASPRAAGGSGRAREIPRFEWAQKGPHEGAGTADSRGAGAGERLSLADGGERFLGRVGVVFVLLAFGFLFKYAFDQGWIGPAARLLVGLAVATAMLLIGLRLEGERERYSQYLLGGAVALYYLVGFASYELYGLVPFVFAFAFMAAVTVLAFVLAERQRLASLAVIGAGGGLATPFLVSTGSGNVPALVAWTLLLLAGAGTLQFWRGWRSLLVVLGLGGLAVMGAAMAMVDFPRELLEVAAVLAGILAVWALFSVLPLLRAHLRRLDPESWPVPGPGSEAPASGERVSRRDWALLRFGCMVGSLIAVLEVGGLFDLDRAGVAPLYAAAALVFAGLAWRLVETRWVLNVGAETASLLLALAIWLLFFDARVFLPLAALGGAMHLLHSRLGLPGVTAMAHALFALLAVLFLGRYAEMGLEARAPLGPLEISLLGAVVLAAVASFALERARDRTLYRGGAHVAFLLWLAVQFAPMELGQELISLSWGVYGIALLLVSLRLDHRGLKLAGLSTLGIVAAKLLLVDMAQVDVIWRILLFMGFGGAFLGLSYLINRGTRRA